MRCARLALVTLGLFAAGCEKEEHRVPLLAEGAQLYAQHCASCHGSQLEGQPNWRERLPNGRLPAPPHDDSGHTWHHPDHVLFAITNTLSLGVAVLLDRLAPPDKVPGVVTASDPDGI